MDEDPIAVDLNVDAALLLKHLVGIDSYPPVLALLPNIFRLADRDRVHEVVAEQLTEVGVLRDGTVHPLVEHWVRCLYRPDVELAARIMAFEPDGEPGDVLRLSLVRTGDSHVLAIRCDDHVVIQPVFRPDRQLDTVTAALTTALGPGPALRFEPLTAPADQLGEVLSEPSEQRRGLLELGATPHTAGVLGRVFGEVWRRAEVVMVEHHDGSAAQPEVCMSVFDTPSGRFVASPSVAMDGQAWVNYAPGDDAALHAGVRALVELLPGRSWFDTSRSG
ncbi:ESX secretion-associated protein EspG [Nocardia macrotermitis]|uniref:ESX-1 secretion-associated protein EspG1 n=1 Tax=Nocardia macrotermitis TaxID=2585198 RepID=A0A7K0DDH5_9NOCA|nr:ESX secretion-associated protein EspG [Nocardia macrotermitis]MQY23850.1 ESX-1 secretion-associated protein EspG1 [Nocardia macrotermitis]